MNLKAKGTRAEYRSRKVLEAAGYSVSRAAGSLGIWDLIAIGPRDIRLIQVKCGARCQISAAEHEQLVLFTAPANTSKEVWKWYDRAKTPVIERLLPGADS